MNTFLDLMKQSPNAYTLINFKFKHQNYIIVLLCDWQLYLQVNARMAK